MVALLVRLKLSLLRGSLRQSVWRVVGLSVSAAFGLGFLVAGVFGLAGARALSPETAGAVVVLGGSVLVVGWLVLPLLMFGTDETLDPSRFALFPLTARQLLPGLLTAGAVGVPGLVTTVVALSTVLTWSRGPVPVVVALLGAVLGVLICLLCARVLTSAFAQLLSSRRFQDVASVLLLVAFMTLGLGFNAVNALFIGSAQEVGQQFVRASTLAGWTPLGWPWSAPVHAAQGDLVLAAVKLLLSAGLVVLLVALWHHFLSVRLTSAVAVGGGPSRRRGAGSRLERLLPATATGATALRCLRYLRRDPRYIANAAGVIIAPVAVLMAWAVGVSACQDTSYDGSAFWTQVTSGIAGRTDRAGRALAQLVWSAPLLLVTAFGLAALTDQWVRLPEVLGLSAATLLCGVGVSAWVSARWLGPVVAPGANPFSAGSGSSFESFLAIIVASLLTGVLVLPVLLLAVATIWVGWLEWVVLLLGPAWGLLVLRMGVRRGGRRLDSHWPEVLQQVSKPIS